MDYIDLPHWPAVDYLAEGTGPVLTKTKGDVMSWVHRRLCGFIAVALLLPVTAALGQAPNSARPKVAPKPPVIPPNVVVERDVQYGQAGDVPLLLDVVRPKEKCEKPRPVIAFIHGGGWRAGSKSSVIGNLLPYAASGNYVGVSIEYRLSDVAIWPAQIHDCKAAIRWIRANAQKYNLDPEKIGVWGGSAGGHLVSMLGVSGGVKELEGGCGSAGHSSQVTCVVDFCGPSDFPAIARVKADAGRAAYNPVSMLLGGPVEEKQDLAKSASPITYVSSGAPPFLVVHGTADPIVPLDQATSFHAALKKAGVSSTFLKIEGGGHGIGGPEVQKRVQAFFEKHLRGQPVEVSDEPIQAPPALKP